MTKKIIESAKAEILDEIQKFNDGFKTIIGERGVKLSGGQRQRLAIARTFYKNPDYSFLMTAYLQLMLQKKKQF